MEINAQNSVERGKKQETVCGSHTNYAYAYAAGRLEHSRHTFHPFYGNTKLHAVGAFFMHAESHSCSVCRLGGLE